MDYSKGYSPWKDSPNSSTKDKFGDADFDSHMASGGSASEALKWYEANPSKQGDKGIGGNLHQKMVALAAAEKAQQNSGGGGGGGNNYTPRPISNDLPGADRPVINDADRITIGVGKDGDMYTGIGNDNVITNSDIGNDNSETTLRMRLDAAERAQNHLDLLANFGKKGHMTTEIGDRNVITDSRIGNDNSITRGWIDFGTGLDFT